MSDAFVLSGWDIEDEVLALRYEVAGFSFRETYRFPELAKLDEADPVTAWLIDLLHAVAGVSYYKAMLSREIHGVRESFGSLCEALYFDGLGEFFLVNKIVPYHPLFVYAKDRDAQTYRPRWHDPLVAVGGGKDSVVSLELLRDTDVAAFSVNPTEAAFQTIRKFSAPSLFVKRNIDPLLLELNSAGATNGHIPITAINSVTGLIIAAATEMESVVFSNEGSASTPMGNWRGMPVNHQYSKSLAFEKLLQQAVYSSVGPHLQYYSLLRRYSEVKICQMFAEHPAYFPLICSCNRVSKRVNPTHSWWCGECEKCAFVFLALAVFLPAQDLISMFGRNMLDDPWLLDVFITLTGESADFPLECVGTVDECRWCVTQLHDQQGWRDTAVIKSLGPLSWKENPLTRRYEESVPANISKLLDDMSHRFSG